MSYRVCIPCAGTGSRLGELTRFLNKSLVSIANRPTLSHLIERFPEDVEFVIALGHKGHLVREYLELAYPERTFHFAVVAPFEGPGSGLGLSLLACREYLQQPFIFMSCDTLTDEAIPAPDENWMGFAEADDISAYRTVALKGNDVVDICEKGIGEPATHKPYIGLAGIQDFAAFWLAMEQGGSMAIDTGEAYGLRRLLEHGIKARRFTWHDTGNLPALAAAREHFREPDEPNILDKANEAIWFVGDAVIKFSDDKKFIANRIKRVAELQGYVPQITAFGENMYRYGKVTGRVLSEVVTLPRFHRLLEFSQGFWAAKQLNTEQKSAFEENCLRFYRDKTLERVELFYSTCGKGDGTETINGVAMPTLRDLLGRVDWNWLAQGLPGRFHGDFHFENIIVTEQEQFVFLDWRQDFGGDLTIGDVYYDLAKILHGLIINHELINLDLYHTDWQADQIAFDVHRRQSLVDCERYFEVWLANHGYDVRKVRVLTALIYLNIAPLHHHPYTLLLYSLGKSMLRAELEK